jgi:beta propeller repeat protein
MSRARVRTCAFTVGVVAAFASSVRADVAGTTQQLGAAPGTTQMAPAISGTGVVWTHYDGTQFDIYYVDVTPPPPGAPPPTPVNLTNSRDNEFLEDIDRGSVVYTHTGGPLSSPGDILLLDTATGKITNVAAGGDTVHFAHPAISGRYIVFERITSQYDIDIYDSVYGGSPGMQVTNDAAIQLHPRVSGNVVVYEDYGINPAGAPAVYGFYAPSGPSFLIAATGRLPDVDGDNVVYVGADATGRDQIMLYNVVSKNRSTLTTAASDKSTPRISGNRVVWSDNRNGTDDVWSFDLATRAEALLAGGPGSQTVGDISGNRVVYSGTDASGQNSGVYLFTYAGPPESNLPVGCDPSRTDVVNGPVTLTQPSAGRAGTDPRSFVSQPDRTYYVCVENGLADGSRRSAQAAVVVDNGMVLIPADFKPQNDPPRYVAAKLSLTGTQHRWEAAVFGRATPPSLISVTIRVAKP